MQVELTPEATAVVFEQDRLTYRELNRRANRLAHRLRKLGVGPEVCVAICVERSIQMLVGLLAILKAGAAYVPLDPMYPKDRLAYMLEDTGAPVLVTQREMIERLPDHTATIVELDSAWEAVAKESEANLASRAATESPAYVIYTSGQRGSQKEWSSPTRM
jgi:non-ribosomal peptide synthetase component F